MSLYRRTVRLSINFEIQHAADDGVEPATAADAWSLAGLARARREQTETANVQYLKHKRNPAASAAANMHAPPSRRFWPSSRNAGRGGVSAVPHGSGRRAGLIAAPVGLLMARCSRRPCTADPLTSPRSRLASYQPSSSESSCLRRSTGTSRHPSRPLPIWSPTLSDTKTDLGTAQAWASRETKSAILTMIRVPTVAPASCSPTVFS